MKNSVEKRLKRGHQTTRLIPSIASAQSLKWLCVKKEKVEKHFTDKGQQATLKSKKKYGQ